MKSKILKSLSWNLSSGVTIQIINYCTTILLARILTPKDFGLIASVLILISFVDIIKDLGFGMALVQREENSQLQYSSVFWFNIFFGACFTLLFVVLSSDISKFYNQEELKNITPFLALGFFITSLHMVHGVILTKNYKFDTLSKGATLSALFSGVLSLVLVFFNFSVWALVIRNLSSRLFTLFYYYYCLDWKPSLQFSIKSLKNLLSYSVNFTGSKVLQYWSKKIDDILIGKFLGTESLGIYSKAFSFIVFPWTSFKSYIASVLFVSLSDLKNDSELGEIYIKFSIGLSSVLFPLCFGIFAVSEEFILVLIGERWIDTIALVKIFCIASIVQAIGFPNLLLNAVGKANLVFRITICTRFIYLLFILLGFYMGGLINVTIFVSIGMIINVLTFNYFALKEINMPLFTLVKFLVPFLLFSTFMFFCLEVSEYFFLQELMLSLKLLIKISLGLIIYMSLIFLIKPFPIPIMIDIFTLKLKHRIR